MKDIIFRIVENALIPIFIAVLTIYVSRIDENKNNMEISKIRVSILYNEINIIIKNLENMLMYNDLSIVVNNLNKIDYKDIIYNFCILKDISLFRSKLLYKVDREAAIDLINFFEEIKNIEKLKDKYNEGEEIIRDRLYINTYNLLQKENVKQLLIYFKEFINSYEDITMRHKKEVYSYKLHQEEIKKEEIENEIKEYLDLLNLPTEDRADHDSGMDSLHIDPDYIEYLNSEEYMEQCMRYEYEFYEAYQEELREWLYIGYLEKSKNLEETNKSILNIKRKLKEST